MKKVITKKLQADNDCVPSPEQAVPRTPSYEHHSLTPSYEQHSVTPSLEQHSVTPSHEQNSVTPSHEQHSVIPSDEQHSVTPSHEQNLVTPSHEQHSVTPSCEQHSVMAETSPSIHPPLPVDPPLPPPANESLAKLVVPKREIIDDQNDSSTNDDYVQLKLNNELLKNMKMEPNKIEEMCRDWVRGTCTRENCKYSHVRDLKQLPRVYKFCHDYQNKGCLLPKCKFVHATVHEQELFIRTGVLPPHALAHLKLQLSTPAPPPPLPPPTNAPLSSGPSGQHLVRNGPMPNQNPMPSTSRDSVDTERPSTSRMNSAPIMPVAGPSGLANTRMPPPGPPPNWNGEPTCSTPEEGCRNCVVMEHRVQHAKNNLANIDKNLERSAKEMILLDQKEKRLMAVMNLWFQTCNGGSTLGPKNNSKNNHNNNNNNQNQ